MLTRITNKKLAHNGHNTQNQDQFITFNNFNVINKSVKRVKNNELCILIFINIFHIIIFYL